MDFRTITVEEKNQGYFKVEVPSGGSKSEALNVSSVVMYAIEHGNWTPSDLTFQVSLDSETWVDLYTVTPTGDSEQESIPFADIPQVFRLEGRDWSTVRFIRFRSGFAGSTIIQDETRILKIGCK